MDFESINLNITDHSNNDNKSNKTIKLGKSISPCSLLDLTKKMFIDREITYATTQLIINANDTQHNEYKAIKKLSGTDIIAHHAFIAIMILSTLSLITAGLWPDTIDLYIFVATLTTLLTTFSVYLLYCYPFDNKIESCIRNQINSDPSNTENITLSTTNHGLLVKKMVLLKDLRNELKKHHISSDFSIQTNTARQATCLNTKKISGGTLITFNHSNFIVNINKDQQYDQTEQSLLLQGTR